MNHKEGNQTYLIKEDDFAFVRELIGSAIYFPKLSQYALVIEDKLKQRSPWKTFALLEHNGENGCFINHRESGRFGPASLGFYDYNSSILREIKRRSSSLLRILEPPIGDSYEMKLVGEGIKALCLAPIVVRERFMGVVVGFSEDKNISKRDNAIMEVIAEVVAISLEKFHLKNKSDKYQKQIRDYRNRLVNIESIKIMGELGVGASHNLNNLLAGILGYIQLISLKVGDPELRPLLDEIRSSIMSGKETVKDFLEFRKMDMDVAFDVVNLEDIAKRSVSLTRTKWQDEAWAKNAEYKIEMDFRDSSVVMGNPSTLLEAFIVMLFKTIESVPNGGKIIIEGYNKGDLAFINFTAAKEVRMSEGLLSLDPFIHNKESNTSEFNIAVAEEIIKRHQGSLTIENKIGQGTQIRIQIPLIEEEITKEEIVLEEVIEKISARILVVEDEPIVRALLRDVLVEGGFTVVSTEDGNSALEILKNDTDFDALLTDLSMPNMSGFDLAERVRVILPDIPVIMATGWESQIDRKKVEEYSINSVVGKPFHFDELIDTINKCLMENKKD